MTSGCWWWYVLGAAALVGLPCPALSAPTSEVEFTAVRVGLADSYRLGVWTPVELTLRADRAVDGRVEIVVPDGDGVPVCYATPADRPVRLAPGHTTHVVLDARFGRSAALLTARFCCDAKPIAERVFPGGLVTDEHVLVPPALDLEERLLVAVGPGGVGLSEAVVLAENSHARLRVVELSDVARLPDRWYGYEAVDMLVFSTSRPELFEGLDEPRREAIDAWVQRGGKLVLIGGPHADRLLAAAGPLARLTPGRLTGVVGLRQTEALESYCQSTVPVPRALEDGELRVARLAKPRGVVEAHEADLPLVVRAPHGFGQVVFFAAELDRPPLALWKGRPLLLRRLLDLPGEEEQPLPVHAMMHYGFVDIAGQLRAALDQFPGVRLAPFWWVAALAVGYILLIGPVDYFLLRKCGRRMIATWVTFPATVLLVGVLAWWLATGLKGRDMRTNQVDLVEVDTVSGLVRGTTWSSLFSPHPDVYNLVFGPQWPNDEMLGTDAGPIASQDRDAARPTNGRTIRRKIASASHDTTMPSTNQRTSVTRNADVQVLAGWLGMPGRGLGGMMPQATVAPVWAHEYRLSTDRTQLTGVPVAQWATKGFTARWSCSAKVDLEARLIVEDQVLEGSLRNTLGVELEHCLLAYGRWAYDLGRLPAGRTAPLGEAVKRSELKNYLTGRRLVFDDSRSRYEEEVAPYDLAGTDVRQILQTMLFFRAAGGSRYTGLVNNYQGFVDASDALRTGRALFVGFVNRAAVSRVGVQLLRDGRPLATPGDPHTVALRFVLPVEVGKP